MKTAGQVAYEEMSKYIPLIPRRRSDGSPEMSNGWDGEPHDNKIVWERVAKAVLEYAPVELCES